MARYRQGSHQPRNIYDGDEMIAVVIGEVNDATVRAQHIVRALNELACNCESYEPCAGECCGIGNCSCSLLR